MPEGIGVVDLMIGFPMRDKKAVYRNLLRGIHDEETKLDFEFPVEYMFKGVPDEAESESDPIDTAFASRIFRTVAITSFGSTSREKKTRSG